MVEELLWRHSPSAARRPAGGCSQRWQRVCESAGGGFMEGWPLDWNEIAIRFHTGASGAARWTSGSPHRLVGEGG